MLLMLLDQMHKLALMSKGSHSTGHTHSQCPGLVTNSGPHRKDQVLHNDGSQTDLLEEFR